MVRNPIQFQTRFHNMTREPNIVTKGWFEVAGSLKKTGFFREDQLNPESVPLLLADLVRRYPTIVGYGVDGQLIPIGSGTFLRRSDGQCGILTAGHVVGAIRNKENIRVLPTQYRQEVDWVRIAGEGMKAKGENNNTATGPDIGWMPLSAEEVNWMEALGAVFHNRGRSIEEFAGEVCQINIIFGFVAAKSSPNDKIVVADGMLIGKTKEEPSDEQGWDYGEYAITSEDDWIPRTHGGVSGSAVWRIDLPMDGQGRKAVRLEGVVYAEGPEGDRKLIAHGEQSVRIILGES